MAEIKRLTGRKLKPSTLYPLLYKLEADGYLVGEWAEKGKRGLRRYSLTGEGKVLLTKVSGLLSKSMRKVFDDLLSERKDRDLSELRRF
jgi:DNA-binding PadR family transcriptional regulator